MAQIKIPLLEIGGLLVIAAFRTNVDVVEYAIDQVAARIYLAC